MLYNININQISAINSGLNLDIKDFAIWKYIQECVSSNIHDIVMTSDGVIHIPYNSILQALPLLGIKTKGSLSRRLDNLVTANVLIKHANGEFKKGINFYKF